MNTFIAMAAMLIDHIGAMFYPDSVMFRIFGRLAFPLYCWFLVQGYIHTRSHKRYMLRLLILAAVSQIPFMLAMGRNDLNVIATLLLGLIGLYAYDRIKGDLKMAAVLAVMAVSTVVPMDYGLYGILLIFIYRFAEGWIKIAGHLLLNVFYLLINGTGYWIQMFSIFAAFLIVYPFPLQIRYMPKWFYRAFYPAHLAILYGIKQLGKWI